MFVGIAIMIFCQIAVYRETRRHEQQLASQQASEEARQNFLKEKKAFKLTSTIVVTLLLTYLPIFVVRILIVNSVIRNKNVVYIALYSAVFIGVFNSFINPIIYCVRTRQFRVAFIEILFRKNNSQNEDIEMRVFGTWNAVALLEEERNLEFGPTQMNKSTPVVSHVELKSRSTAVPIIQFQFLLQQTLSDNLCIWFGA